MKRNLEVAECARIGDRAIIGEGVQIGKKTKIGDRTVIGEDTQIGKKAKIGEGVIIGDKVRIAEECDIQANTVIMPNVVIGKEVCIGEGVLIMAKAQICPNSVESESSNARLILDNASIGPEVKLDDEVEIGVDAIIPTQQTIANIGKFGAKNRVVTIYGSEYGPRYSIGCQIGEDFRAIKMRILSSKDTMPESAATYHPYLGVFEEIGSIVQHAYEKEDKLIDEIQSLRFDHELSQTVDYPEDDFWNIRWQD